MIVSTVRWYDTEGNHINTSTVRSDDITDHNLRALIGAHVGREYKPTAWTNIMIRENGKLVSYKKFGL